MCKLRKANVEDWAEIATLLMDMQEESDYYSQFECDTTYFFNVMEYIEDGGHFAMVAEIDGKIVGVMLGVVQTIPFVLAMCASEIVVYVRPENRGGSAAFKLVKSFEDFAIYSGAEVIFVGVGSDEISEKAGTMYERLEYSHKGTSYMKRLH